MSYRETLFNKEQSRLIINNFKFSLEEACRRLSIKHRDDVGILYPERQLFARMDSLVDEYGVEIVGTALEIKRRGVVITDARLYYEANMKSAIGVEIDEFQEDWVTSLIYDLTEMTSELMEEIEKEIRKEDEGENRERVKLTKQELEAEYKRERKRLQSLFRRRKKAGVDIDEMEIPGIPKKVTEGSIRRLQKLANKLKTVFRYLSGGRYRGMK